MPVPELNIRCDRAYKIINKIRVIKTPCMSDYMAFFGDIIENACLDFMGANRYNLA